MKTVTLTLEDSPKADWLLELIKKSDVITSILVDDDAKSQKLDTKKFHFEDTQNLTKGMNLNLSQAVIDERRSYV